MNGGLHWVGEDRPVMEAYELLFSVFLYFEAEKGLVVFFRLGYVAFLPEPSPPIMLTCWNYILQGKFRLISPCCVMIALGISSARPIS